MNYFKCYSANFHAFLQAKGVRYIVVAKDICNGKTFWLYLKDKKFAEVAAEWNTTRPSSEG